MNSHTSRRLLRLPVNALFLPALMLAVILAAVSMRNRADLVIAATITEAQADGDGDGVPDASDNCPIYANADQADTDGDSKGNVCDAAVIAVPWFGFEGVPHQVFSGTQIILQAAAYSDPSQGTPLPLKSGTWDPGIPGVLPQAINVSNPRALELTMNYAGAVGQPFTATIRVVDTFDNVYTDTFKIVIAANNRDTKVNMAIDKALWNLHKKMVLTTSDGMPSGRWSGYAHYYMAATAGAVQAFEINNHLESADPSKNPYVNDVKRGLRYILSDQHGVLRSLAVPMQNGKNPDSNSNGFGLQVLPGDHSTYIGGQVIDAIVASGTQNKLAETGQVNTVRGRKYRDIVQDMLDGYSYGLADNTGGWGYTMVGTTGNNDTSASHWWAIGVLAAEVWGLDAPQWVKDIQWNIGVPLMQLSPGPPMPANGCYFGYTNFAGNHWGDNQMNVTTAGLILMNADDISQNHPRFVCAEKWINTFFNNQLGNFYTMYQLAKAMRTARNDAGQLAPIAKLFDTRDWYAAYADWLIGNQSAGGDFPTNVGSISAYIQTDMRTSWGVIILSSSLFELPPVAACTANPNELGSTGGVVNFSAAGSTHPNPSSSIVSYSWNFDDGTPAGTGVTTSHTFTTPGSYPTTRNVTVTVTDNKNLTDTATCAVTIVDTNVKPNANAGGPYDMCIGTPFFLDGSSSTDSDGNIVTYQWSWGSPLVPQAGGAVVDATAAFTALGVGVHDVGLRVTDNGPLVKSDDEFTTVTVRVATDPLCNQPPVATNNSYDVNEDEQLERNVITDAPPDTDEDGDALSATLQGAGVQHGSLAFNPNGTFTYTPTENYCGPDSFSYRLNDGTVDGNVASVSINVECVNDDPVAVGDSITTNEDTDGSGLVSSTDIDGGAPKYTVSSGPSHGSVVLNENTGEFTYTPVADYHGPDSFTFSVSDGKDGTASGNVSITVAPVNDPPVAGDSTPTTPEDTELNGSVSSSDIDGDTGTYAAGTGPLHGALVLNPNGTYTYTPADDYNGPDSFTFTVADGNGGADQGIVSITVTPVNDAPVAADSSETTSEDTQLAGSVSSSDIDLDAPTYAVVSGPTDGTLVLNPTTGAYTYTPNANDNGPDSFTFSVDDGAGGTDTGVVDINVIPVNDLPVCSAAGPSVASLWPPDHGLSNIEVFGVIDPVEKSAITINVTGIFQDEPTNTVGDGNTSIDGFGVGTPIASVRRERSGSKRVPGDGRMYYIEFTGTDAEGGECKGTVQVGVPHDLGQDHAIGAGGPNYKSTGS